MPGLQKIPKETILGAIAKLGPCQPIDIRKEIKQGDTFLIGAMLSELVAGGELVISKTRRGGSPFYYDPKRPETLEMIAQYLNEKDRRTCALLREQRILREDAVEPLVRVGLQNIHDFAQRMTVKEDGGEVVYWRYYLTSEADARKIINGSPSAAPKPESSDEKKVEVTRAEEKGAPAIANASDAPAQKQEVKGAAPEPKKETKEIKLPSPAMHPAQAAGDDAKAEPEGEAKPKKRAPRAKSSGTSPAAPQPSLQDWLIHDTLYEKVQVYAVGVKGILTHQQSIKPNAELTCVLSSEGPYGRLSVFVLALNKKKIVEKDITTALLQARGQGMPLLVLSVEPLPAKVTKSFETTLNAYFKKF